MSNFETQAIWFAQHRSRNVKKSVWDPSFLAAMAEILRDGWWQEYPHEAWGRICKFDDVKDFLTSEDGLGWPDVKATCAMIRSVANSEAALTIRKDANNSLRDLALQLLAELEAVGVDELAAAAAEAKPTAAHRRPTTEEQANKVADRHFKPTNKLSSESRTRIIERIARDFPQMLNEIGPGKKYRSARQAGIAAGFIQDVPTVRLTEPSRIAEALWTKLSREELAMLVAALTERLTSAN